VAKKNSRKPKGFTLIELMIVIAIVGILASVAVPMYSFYRSKGYMAAVRSDAKNAHTSIMAWVTENPNTSPPDEVFDGPGTMVHYPIAKVSRGVRISIDNGGDVTATHGDLSGMYKIIFNGAIEVDTLAP
jgi:prepilin-type N-terminal cleavage/methylation domain-containing protein